MEKVTFEIEYHDATDELSDKLKAKVERRLGKLARGHRDITGASVALKTTSKHPSNDRYQVRMVLYCRPDNIAAQEKGDVLSDTVGGVLDALERQVRSGRERKQEAWKRHRGTEK